MERSPYALHSHGVSSLVDFQVQLALSHAFDSLRQIFRHSVARPHSLNPRLPLRYRSASTHRHDRKMPFHHASPRCSLPSTKNDLIFYQTRVLSSERAHQMSYPASRRGSRNGFHRRSSVRYSFSLHKSWSNEISQMSLHWFTVQNYATDVSEQSIRTALLQIDDQHSRSPTHTDPSSERPASTPLIDQFAENVVQTIIGRSLETLFASTIRPMSDYLTEDIVTDALSIIAEREMRSRSIVTGHGQLLLSTRRRSTDPRALLITPTYRSGASLLTAGLISNQRSPLPREAVSSMINEMTQRIYMHSIDDLRQ